MTVYSSVLDLIGNTPMVDVSALSPHPGTRILVKLEGQNPAGSVKDRIAKAMVEEAEADGTLVPGRTIIEPSSGNTGIALAMIARLRGYPIKVVLPENVSVERRQMLEVFGAEIISSPGAEGSNGAVRLARRLADENPDWAFLYQYANEANPRVHYATTGPEILRDVPDITHFVAGLGTSGTLMGVGTYLREQRPEVQVLAVEPPSGEVVQGLRSLEDVRGGLRLGDGDLTVLDGLDGGQRVGDVANRDGLDGRRGAGREALAGGQGDVLVLDEVRDLVRAVADQQVQVLLGGHLDDVEVEVPHVGELDQRLGEHAGTVGEVGRRSVLRFVVADALLTGHENHAGRTDETELAGIVPGARE